MYKGLLDMTPFRAELLHSVSPKTWAEWEIFFSILVILFSFAQSKYDHIFSTKGILGFLGSGSLVMKTTFAFAMIWDGLYVTQHSQTEQGRPVAVMLLAVIVSQQSIHLLLRWATREIVHGHTWLLFLIDAPEMLKTSRFYKRR